MFAACSRMFERKREWVPHRRCGHTETPFAQFCSCSRDQQIATRRWTQVGSSCPVLSCPLLYSSNVIGTPVFLTSCLHLWRARLIVFHNIFTIFVFEVVESIADISCHAAMFGWPQKSRSTSGSGGTDQSVLWIFLISPLLMFSSSRNPLLTFLISYRVWVTSKIQVDFRFNRYSEVLIIVSLEYS